MAYQSNKPKDPPLYHSNLVKGGPKLVSIKSAPKWVKSNTLCVIEVIVDGVTHVYFTENRDIASKFQQYVGKSVVLIASGNSKQKTDSMEIQPAGVPASSLPAAQSAPQSPQKPVETVITAPVHKDKEAKQFLCQAANLMRLCVKKANDIAVELDLPNEHRQGIASSLFIQADRSGLTFKMPIQPYSPEELGYGASKAESLKTPQPEEDAK